MKVTEIVEKCETLYNDLGHECVKAWKQKTGGKAVGFMPIYVPREIIHAAGMLPVGVMGGGDGIEIIRGDAFYQSYICHIPRSTVEMGLTGRLDCLDGMLFPAICDVIRNLSGMWKLMFEDRYARYVDFPQNFAGAIGGTFYMTELRGIAKDMTAISGIEVSEERLRESIALYNQNRHAIDQLYRLRAESPHLVPTIELYLLMRASNLLPVEEHTALVKEYVGVAKQREAAQMDNIRVIVTGVFCEQPSLGLVRALEQSGCYIVDDDWLLGARYINGDVSETGDPMQALCDAYLERGVATSSRYIDKDVKGRDLIERVRDLGAEGVVFASPSFCDPALLERPMLQAALAKEGIPYTAFKFAENSGQYQAIKEQTGTFSDSIKLWGTA